MCYANKGSKDGSKEMAYDGYRLSTPNIHWLGLRPTDLESYHLDSEEILKTDLATANNLLSESFVQNNADWVAELHRMVRKKEKVGLHALDEEHLVNYYLPLKLQVLNWIYNIQYN
jgi:DNA topoisomerase VI subunit A